MIMTSGKNTPPLLRQSWLMFSDVNTRCNILIEECAHLQGVIYSLIPPDIHLAHLFRKSPTQADCGITETKLKMLKNAGFERPVILKFKVDEAYPGSTPRARALLSLWNTLGGLIIGLLENQNVLRRRYQTCVNTTRSHNSDPCLGRPETFFWFAAMRGYLINTAFNTYTKILEHAHEKIIQLQENRPGTLPAPILLRRWNSALQGDFLSRYARHVDWEAATFIKRLVKSRSDTKQEGRNGCERRHTSAMSHTWTHAAASAVQAFSINGDTDVKWRFGTLRSAFFYLEQPALFPLLYHESSHLNFPDTIDPNSLDYDFFSIRHDATIALSRPANFSPTSKNFWDQYTEEVWADCLAVALSGRAYLGALSLQIFGLSGTLFFSHVDFFDDQVFPLDTLGEDDKRSYLSQHPTDDEAYFWEARLLIALRLCRSLHQDPVTITLCKEIEIALDEWYESGLRTFSAGRVSDEHEEHWKYRREINEWVCDTAWTFIKDYVDELAEEKDISCMNVISEECLNKINSAVEKFLDERFKNNIKENFFNETSCRRLENIALDVRLRVGQAISREMDASSREKSQSSSDEYIENISEGFASWSRNDGSMAFRLALEWYLVRLSQLEEHIDKLGNNPENRTDLDKEILASLKLKLPFNLNKTSSPDCLKETKKLLLEWSNMADTIIDVLIPRSSSETASEISVGTLCLGNMRPSQVLMNDTGGYAKALMDVKNHFDQMAAGSHEKRFPKTKYAHDFSPLIGEYQFVTFSKGNTPTEREFYPKSPPLVLIKPRLVFQVFGENLNLKNRQKEKDNKIIGRISLIHFKHRHQWHTLYKSLQEHSCQFEGASMFVSSAWEDAVLITWHKSDKEMWKSFNILGLSVSHKSSDAQSSILCPMSLFNENRQIESYEENTKKGFVTLLASALNKADVGYRTINNRLGRHDYSVIWDEQRPSEIKKNTTAFNRSNRTAAEVCADALSSLPTRIWKDIGGISHAYECALCSSFYRKKKEPKTTYEQNTTLRHRKRSAHSVVTNISIDMIQEYNAGRFLKT